MSHMINLYKLENERIVEIEMEKIQQALTKLTLEDWSDFEGGDASIEFKGLKPIQQIRSKSKGLKGIFSRSRKNGELETEANEQEIDADTHSIAFNRPQSGFEFAMFELMLELKLIAVRDESFSETEAIISIAKLEKTDIPDEIDSIPTEGMELIQVVNPEGLLNALYD